MTVIFAILVHTLLFLSALGLAFLIWNIIFYFQSPTNRAELVMRALAASCGLLAYVGARAVGLSVPEVMFQSLSTSFPLSFGILGIVAPSVGGILLSWYVIRQLQSKETDVVGARILALVMTFVFFLYCDAYTYAFDSASRKDLIHVVPNLTFVLSVLAYAVFKYQPPIQEPVSQREWKWRHLFDEPAITLTAVPAVAGVLTLVSAIVINLHWLAVLLCGGLAIGAMYFLVSYTFYRYVKNPGAMSSRQSLGSP